MAIKLVYLSAVIPVSTILARFPGGWDGWIEANSKDKLGPWWSDGQLFARASMDPGAIERIAERWEHMGFTGKTAVNGEFVWVDFCRPESGGACDWLSYCEDAPAVYLSGQVPGRVVGPAPRERDEAGTIDDDSLWIGIAQAVFLLALALAVLFWASA